MTSTSIAGTLKEMTKKHWLFGVLIFACEVRSERVEASAPAPVETSATPTETLPRQAPTTLAETPTQKTPEGASLDYLKDGLAGVWSGRITKPEELMRWFVPGEASQQTAVQILRDQPGDGSITLLDAVIIGVRAATATTPAEVDYFLSTTSGGVIKCYQGTHQWVQQPDGDWRRTSTSALADVPGCSAQKVIQP
jgi:hypothetical protein